MAVRHLQTPQQRPPSERIVQPQNVSTWRRRQYAGIKPETLKAVIRDVERGDLEDWADLTSFMLRTDAHLSSVYSTLIDSVAGADLEIQPGEAKGAREQEAAELGAELWREQLDAIGDTQSLFSKLLHGEGVGWAVAEHRWQNVRGTWVSHPEPVHPRDVGIADDWTWKVRTYQRGIAGEWIRLDEVHPLQFMVHIPGGIADTPQLGGLLQSVAWVWLFKRWAMIWQQDALERFATPHILGRVADNTNASARNALWEAIQNLSAEHAGIVEGTSDEAALEIIEPSTSPGQSWREAIGQYDSELSKRLLGSTLNVEIGDTGGNRAAAESQGLFTILPRLQRIGGRLSSTLARQWARHVMRLNTHRTLGVVAPTPHTVFRFVQDDPPEIGADEIAGGLKVRNDEWRTAKGLEPLGGDVGNAIVTPAAQTAPAPAARDEGAGHVPFDRTQTAASLPMPQRQMSLPYTRRRTSRTSSRSRTTQIARVPHDV